MLRLVGSALLIIIVLIFEVLLINILITICMKKCCAASPLTQAIAIINSELSEGDNSVQQGEGDTQGLGTDYVDPEPCSH